MVSFFVKIGIPFLVVPIVVCFLLIYAQFRLRERDTHRVQILSVRCSVFLIVYPAIMYASLAGGVVVYLILQIPLAMFEGYMFYCFFTMIVVNFGGAEEMVEYMNKKQFKCLTFCCRKEKKLIYESLCDWLYRVRVIRPVTTVLQTILGIAAYLTRNFAAVGLTALLTAINAVMLLYTVSLLMFICKLYSVHQFNILIFYASQINNAIRSFYVIFFIWLSLIFNLKNR
jgi:hypothetical protein